MTLKSVSKFVWQLIGYDQASVDKNNATKSKFLIIVFCLKFS